MGNSRTGTNALKISGKAKEGEGTTPGRARGAESARRPGGRRAGRRACPRDGCPCQGAGLQQLEKKGTAKRGRGRQLRLPGAPHSSFCFKE